MLVAALGSSDVFIVVDESAATEVMYHTFYATVSITVLTTVPAVLPFVNNSFHRTLRRLTCNRLSR